MLIDLHAHSSGISHCCRIPIEEVLPENLARGMDGIALTNHYTKNYCINDDADAFAQRYIDEFYAAKALEASSGCRVFFGIEVTMELYHKVHMLVYGVEPEFAKRHPRMFDYTQQELYEAVKAEGGILVQAHPFRSGATVLDPAYLDGVEINCHPKYKNSYSDVLQEIATEHHLIVTCGGDYHADNYHPKCGTYIPDDIKDEMQLCHYLMTSKENILCVQEPNTDTCVDLHYKRTFPE